MPKWDGIAYNHTGVLKAALDYLYLAGRCAARRDPDPTMLETLVAMKRTLKEEIKNHGSLKFEELYQLS